MCSISMRKLNRVNKKMQKERGGRPERIILKTFFGQRKCEN
jgi:hypothetical protein